MPADVVTGCPITVPCAMIPQRRAKLAKTQPPGITLPIRGGTPPEVLARLLSSTYIEAPCEAFRACIYVLTMLDNESVDHAMSLSSTGSSLRSGSPDRL